MTLMPTWQADADVVVIGSGVAGLTTAHDCAAAGLRVLLMTKDAASAGSTAWAQGGIAVVDASAGDSLSAHLQDTVVAGAGLTDPVAAQAIVTEGVDAVARLAARGASFDSGPTGLSRTREGGHHFDRIIHSGGDATGAEVERALLAAPGLPTVVPHHFALDIVRDADGKACGVTVLDQDGEIGVVLAAAIVLATGGSGQLFAATSNPSVSTADGMAMALRAGAEVCDIEFVQFHPTVLYTGAPQAGQPSQRPLVSEAVRGAGAFLVDGAGKRVMKGMHPMEDLAPRDVVSLAITRRMHEAPGGIADHVFVDARGIDDFAGRFPTITASCAAESVDPAKDLIPVAPASHYQCGGVTTDLHGRTTVSGLFAVGEVARTGLHGANRLASNSLLEGLVMGERAAETIIADHQAGQTPSVPAGWPEPQTTDPTTIPALQLAMSADCGIGRTATGLVSVIVQPASTGGEVSRATAEAANLSLTAKAILVAALVRTESRGCHVRLDFPERRLEWAQPITLTLNPDGRVEVADLRQEVSA